MDKAAATGSRGQLLFILLTVCLDSIGIGIIFPVMPDLLRAVTATDLASASLWGGALATAFAVMQFLFGPIVGNLSDCYGRRPVMLVSLGVMALNYVLMAVAASVWLLLVGRIIAGITAATYATANAYVADISHPEERARRFGYLGAAFGIGFILGPLIGGLAAGLGPRAPFWIAAVFSAANLVYGFIAFPESLPAALRRPLSFARANPFAAFRAVGRLPGLGRMLAIIFFYALAIQSYPAIWAFFGAERFGWNAWWNGMALALYGVFMALVQAFGVAPAMRLWGGRRTAIYGMIAEIVAFLYYGFATSGLVTLMLSPIAALGGVTGPALQSMMTNRTPDTQQGELQGVVSSVTSVAMGLAPVVITPVFWAFTHEGAPVYAPGAPFLLAAMIMVICVAFLVAPARAEREDRPLTSDQKPGGTQ